MATLTWGDVVVVGLVACLGFTLLSFWVSAWMSRHNVTGQLKGKPPKPKDAGAQVPATGAASSKPSPPRKA